MENLSVRQRLLTAVESLVLCSETRPRIMDGRSEISAFR